jgi:hypothetical protein
MPRASARLYRSTSVALHVFERRACGRTAATLKAAQSPAGPRRCRTTDGRHHELTCQFGSGHIGAHSNATQPR